MKKLLLLCGLITFMVMIVPRADAAGPPGYQENSISLCIDQMIVHVEQIAMMPDVSFAADLPVLIIRATGDPGLEKLYLIPEISFKHPPNYSVGLMISKNTSIDYVCLQSLYLNRRAKGIFDVTLMTSKIDCYGMQPQVRKWSIKTNDGLTKTEFALIELSRHDN
jgi:hypothetical protein